MEGYNAKLIIGHAAIDLNGFWNVHSCELGHPSDSIYIN
jgi:hypothetical protein